MDSRLDQIPHVDNNIIKATEKEGLVVFIGAGISRIIGAPSWNELAQQYLKHIFETRHLIPYSDYRYLKKIESRKLLSICNEILKINKLNNSFNLIQALETDTKKSDKFSKYSDVFKYLYDFNCIFITTNYDSFLDQFVELSNSKPSINPQDTQVKEKRSIIYHFEDLNFNLLKNGNVIHIHGSIHDERRRPVVMTITDYFNAYERNSNLSQSLVEIFDKKTVLFIGYGLEEYEVLEYMLNSNRNKKDKKHFMLYPFLDEDKSFIKHQELYYNQLGISLISYSISKVGYEQIFNVIKDWSKIIGPKSKSQTYIDNLNMIDEVL